MRHDRISTNALRLDRASSAAALLSPLYAGMRSETLAVLHLDRGFRLIRTSFVRGQDSVVLPIRRIAREAAAAGTCAIVIAHNHPGGDASPSRADRRATCRLAEALRPLSVLLADHIIFGERNWFSFQAEGWL